MDKKSMKHWVCPKANGTTEVFYFLLIYLTQKYHSLFLLCMTSFKPFSEQHIIEKDCTHKLMLIISDRSKSEPESDVRLKKKKV